MKETGLNGILNVLKPPGMTSFDVVAYLRRLLGLKKIGHTGTLDPGAAGVLPVCLGNATKAIEFLTEKDKLYRAELTLGISTDTQDAYGNILKLGKPGFDENKIRETVSSFTGEYDQVPPMYSSVRINGKRLYELARNGIEIERSPRKVIIYSADIIAIRTALVSYQGNDFDCIKVLYDVHCSKGTYIRTLCNDIGERLGCGGHMSFLLRMKTGIFELGDALSLGDIEQLGTTGGIAGSLVPVDRLFEGMTAVYLAGNDMKRLLNGAPVIIPDRFNNGDKVRVYDSEGRFTALGSIKYEADRALLKSNKLFV